MSDTMVKLSDLSDPVAFLTGARIPLITTDGRRAEVAGDLLFVWNPITASYGSCAVARMGREPWLSMDLADPDVARWCDRRIAEIYQHLPRYDDDIVANFCGAVQWNIGVVGYPIVDANQWRLRYNDGLHGGGWLILRHDCLNNIPCTDANIPTARTALLRALFGVTP